MTPRSRSGRDLGALALALVALAVPVTILAHAVVFPAHAPPGAYQKYVLSVPTERDVPTTRIEIRFPAEVTVISFADVPGWDLEVREDADGQVTGAVWNGTLPPGRFVELPFVAVNPRTETRLTWPVVQTYAGGEVVEWSGPEGSETPASVTLVADAGPGAGIWLGAAGIVIGLLALGLALRGRA